jgi:hypothetical protein
MAWIWTGVEIVAVASRIEARQNDAPTVKVMSTGTDTPAGLVQQTAVEGRCVLDISDRQNDTLESGDVQRPRLGDWGSVQIGVRMVSASFETSE